MKKNLLNYVLVECFIILVPLATGVTLGLGRGPVRTIMGDFAPLGFVVLFLFLRLKPGMSTNTRQTRERGALIKISVEMSRMIS